jgi:methylenetetrahydrofolate reductase (NADPH)
MPRANGNFYHNCCTNTTKDHVLPDYDRLISDATHPAPAVSFEFFPPKNDRMQSQLWDSITRLEALQPDFVSVTYGAGGSTRERTHETVRRILEETSLKPAAHLTCVNASRSEIDEVAKAYWDTGVRHIVALRGDPPADSNHYTPHPNGYAYANDLVAGLKKIADFEISVSAYPEGHPESASVDQDIDYLKRKIDAGATRAITQYFFDIDLYARFMERVHKAGITIPIVPGVLPVTNVSQMVKFSKMCGTSVPNWVIRFFDGLDDDPQTRNLVAASLATEQCRLLQRLGCHEFHFYTLNRAELVVAICHMLGIRAPHAHPKQEAA